MIKNKFFYFAAITLICAWGAYFYKFGTLNFELEKFSVSKLLGLSSERADWGTFGDFIGGFSNPVLTFITTCLLIGSLDLQKKANLVLIADSKAQSEREELRCFESSFYSLVEAARNEYSRLSIKSADGSVLRETEAVSFIEEEILNADEGTDLKMFFSELDEEANMGLLSSVRAFCVLFKITKELCPESKQSTYVDICGYILPVRMINLLCLAEVCSNWKFLEHPRAMGFFDVHSNAEYILGIRS